MQFQAYPFEKLNTLLKNITPNATYSPISLTIGEPQFQTPDFIQEALKDASSSLNKYPKTAGEKELIEAQKTFMKKRFDISLEEGELLPSFGTREVLFNFPQFYLHDVTNPHIAFTNPFYQIYEGAAIASRAEVHYINLLPENNFKAIIEPDVLKKCDLVIINFPNNPTSSVLDIQELEAWAKAALEYDFLLINDECYSEIYTNTPPPSLLNAARNIGNTSYKNILVMNSISKRSSAPGLRSGFIAGDARILKTYLQYRTYVGCASPLPLQHAASVAWLDEAHVAKARNVYTNNFLIARDILKTDIPEATFYIWLKVSDDEAFTKVLYERYNVKVLPGSYLSRENVGQGYVRIALVENETNTRLALERVKACMEELR